MAHPFIKFLATLPQFQSALLWSAAIDMRNGAHVTKFEGGDEPKHRNTLSLWWPGLSKDEAFPFEGEKYILLQAYEAARLTGDENYITQANQIIAQ
ncbi:hypothetical protein [Achromobacter sp. ACRQX]|uniref:hypothetical protein n=1 Tax=Achromobacter sp. ACRQX TaxID=2918181 RepID=UPI001EF2D820|nr:hypothetical protein [Achromobacter sp. ACRQX]MCG7328045.1 hypothetical protein [Achromobacter sp. ACRQX]